METISANLLWIMLLLPLLGAAIMPAMRSARSAGVMALIYTLLTFAASLVVLVGTDVFAAEPGIQLGRVIPWVESFGLSFSFGIDSISLWLILLTTFLMPLAVLGSFSAITHRFREYYAWLLILETAMLGTFVARDVIFFYICFEFTLVPLFFLIGIWGSKDRLKAAKVFFLYTFTGSMLTFAGVLYVAWRASTVTGVWSFDMTVLTTFAAHPTQGLTATEQFWVLLALLCGFAVKVPLFPVHTWLPLAHTEAPTAGSVILAGVLLKLGTYGLLRLAIPMCPVAVVDLAPWIGVLAVIGILYTALICWVQVDVKRLIAYSSVSHLGFCVLGMFALNNIGATGSVMYMINHGLSTGALFLCIGMIYERLHTREMSQMSGLGRVMPVWASFMVFFCLASVGLPGLNGFVGEFLTLLGAFLQGDLLGPVYAVAAGLGMIFAAIYILYMVGRVVFGPLKLPEGVHHPLTSKSHGHADHHGDHHDHSGDHGAGGAGAKGAAGQHDSHTLTDLGLREIVVLAPLAVACLGLGLYPTPLLESLEPQVQGLTQASRQVLDQRPADHAAADAGEAVPPTHGAIRRHALDGQTPPGGEVAPQDSGVGQELLQLRVISPREREGER